MHFISLTTEAGVKRNEGNDSCRGIICDGCKSLVQGAQYKCTECLDYVLCVDCNSKGVHSMHKIIKITPTESIWLRKIFFHERSNKVHDSSNNKIVSPHTTTGRYDSL